MKTIQFESPNGQYSIPLKKVAENRADYYAEKEHYSKESKDFVEEVNFVMEDSFEGIDWLINNTNFEDWKDVATKLNDNANVSEDDFWCDSDHFSIKETES